MSEGDHPGRAESGCAPERVDAGRVTQKEITIINKLGLHARAAAKFVTLASAFECEIELVRGEQRVNGKSIMGIMMLAAGKGTQLTIVASGIDEADAVENLENLILQRFGEPE